MTKLPKRNTLFHQFIIRLILPMAITVILAMAASIFVSFQMAQNEQHGLQAIFLKAYAQSLVKPLWDCDDKTAQAITDSMLQTTFVQGIRLSSVCTGNTMLSGIEPSVDIPDYTRQNLNYTDDAQRLFEIGVLEIYFKPVSLLQGTTNSLGYYLSITAIMTLCMLLVTLLTFRNLISRPLTAFQKAISRHEASHGSPVLTTLLTSQNRNDELTDVVKAYDTLMDTVSQQKKTLELQARLDPLTGIGNRLRLEECLAGSLARATRHQTQGFVILIDLDDFKPINDTLGHAAGDAVLQVTAERLLRAVRAEDTVIRLGGDEFVLILEAQNPPPHVEDVVRRVQTILAEPMEFQGKPVSIQASIGYTPFSAESTNRDDLLTLADASMYVQKNIHKHRAE